MIRSHLRLLARCFLTIKSLRTEIESLSCMFNPIYYDSFIQSVNIIGRYDNERELYLSPKTASTLGTLISDVGLIYISECIKNKHLDKQRDAENFLKVKKSNYTSEINKTVIESQSMFRRHKKIILPSKEDIKKLTDYLVERQSKALKILKNRFSYDAWHSLAEATLTSIQLFNRRRPGELERIIIDDFNNYERINKKTYSELYDKLSEKAKNVANRYVRFLIRGKLGRTVAVLLDPVMLESIETILKYRKEARVHKKNKYVFGLPGHDNMIEKHLNACHLMRKFAYDCKPKNPETLRATELRKHIATTCISLNLNSNEVTDLTNFMGHHEKIHMQHYRQPLVSKDILAISKLLQIAQGVDEGDDERIDNNHDSTASTEMLNENDDSSVNIEALARNNLSPERSDVENPQYENRSNTGSQCNDSRVKKRARSTWTEESKNAVIAAFGKSLNKGSQMPHSREIQELIISTPCLQQRNVAQIRTWLHLQRNKFHI
ncbi:uncharacterized protein [Prorops nasuta]|uniref:uncharacterized protein n=1 Tax=Prorops nasuta TaxID=863751 RepID=UPI0034CFA4C9